MKAHACSNLLDEVWETLGRIYPPGEEDSLTDLELVTAMSTNGAVVRVLLCIPTAHCGTESSGGLLAEIEEKIGNLAPLSDVELRVKPSRPAWLTANPYRDPSLLDRSAEIMSLSAHSTCVKSAFTNASRHGWTLDNVQERVVVSAEGADRFDKIRVIVQARVQPEESPLGAA